MKTYLLLVFFFSLTFVVLAQNELIINSEGIPPITSHSGKDYHGFNQVWDVIQDNRGLIYIATTTSLHEYDGEQWRRIETPKKATPRCFDATSKGIYIGGIDLLGKLKPDTDGRMMFHNLKSLLPANTEIGKIEFVGSLNNKVYFGGKERILIYDELLDSFSSIETNTKSYPLVVFDNKMYIHLQNKGIHYFTNDTLVSAYINGGENLNVSDIMPFNNTLLVFTPEKGIYILHDNALRLVSKEQEKFIYKAHKLDNDYYAICTLKHGVFIKDKNHQTVLHLSDEFEINNQVHNAYLDREQNLWLATNYGISIVELGSTWSVFNKSTGIQGTIFDIEEINQKLYLSTSTGIYYKDWDRVKTKVPPLFKKVNQSEIYTYDILPNSNPPLVKAYKSIGQIIDFKYYPIIENASQKSGITYLKDSTIAITTKDNAQEIVVLKNQKSSWGHKITIKNEQLPKQSFFLQYDIKLDRIWGASPFQLFSFEMDQNLEQVVNVQYYDTLNGLPTNYNNWTSVINDQVGFSTKNGWYLYNEPTNQFIKSELFGEYFDDRGIFLINQISDSSFWFCKNGNVRGIINVDAENIHTKHRFTNLIGSNIQSSYYSIGRGGMLGGFEVLNYFQEGKEENYKFEFTPLIRQLDVISGKDSTIFHGIFNNPDSSFSYAQENPIELKYEQNAIRISYSIPYYRHPDKIKYQYQLEGFEADWSEWTEKTEKEYTNLPAGDYIFKVKAMNGFLTESEVGELRIKILAPWYQTWWAYLIYAGLFVGFIRLIVILNSRRLKAENEQLEATIKERVKEIQEQKSVIAQSLVEKESLLKEIHHRVKNNLQIIANLLYLQSGKFEDENIKNVLEEGQGRVRSMALIHQKLYENEDLKSIPFGEYVLELVNEIKTSFGEQAAKVNIKVEAPEAFFDVDSAVPLGLIINELSTNAFKYAFEGRSQGQFSIFLTKIDDEYELHISDNGKGIPEEIDIRKTRSLGLRLVRILSEQLEGEYSFERVDGMSFRLKFVA